MMQVFFKVNGNNTLADRTVYKVREHLSKKGINTTFVLCCTDKQPEQMIRADVETDEQFEFVRMVARGFGQGRMITVDENNTVIEETLSEGTIKILGTLFEVSKETASESYNWNYDAAQEKYFACL